MHLTDGQLLSELNDASQGDSTGYAAGVTLVVLGLLLPAAQADDPPGAVAPVPLAVPAAPPVAEPGPAAAPASPPSPPAQTPQNLYLLGLSAWKHRDFERTLDYATQATNADPRMGEAWLLRSYANLRLHAPDAALLSVKLARSSDREDVRAAARLLDNQLTQPRRRDSPALWAGLGSQLEFDYGAASPVVVLNLGVTVPVLPRLSAEMVVRWNVADPGQFHVGGTTAAALGSWAIPVGKSRWSLNPAAGPSLWLAAGDYWASGTRPYLGLQAQADLDGRFSPTFGVFLDVSGQIYPGQLAELDWLLAPVEAETGVRLWFWGV